MPTQPDRFRNRETDRRYIKFKMKRIKEAKQRGNDARANRHANELLQYLGFDNSETPIESLFAEVEGLETPYRKKIRTYEGL